MAGEPATGPPAPAPAPAAAAPQPSPTPTQTPNQHQPPAAATTPKPAPPSAARTPEIEWDSPVEYEDGQGGFRRATYGQLVEAHQKLQSLGDVTQLQDVMGAMGNDPEATERLLARQLEALRAEKLKKQTPAGDDRVAQLEAKIAALEGKLTSSTRVTQSIEEMREEGVYEQMLGRDSVKDKLPFLSAVPKTGAKIARQFVAAARREIEARGGTFNNDVILYAIQQAEQHQRAMLTPYGVDPAKLAGAAQAGPAPVAVQGGAVRDGSIVREALMTTEDLLRNRFPTPPPGQPVNQPVPGYVPEAGGTPGSAGPAPAAGAIQPGQRYNAGSLIQNLKARRASGAAP